MPNAKASVQVSSATAADHHLKPPHNFPLSYTRTIGVASPDRVVCGRRGSFSSMVRRRFLAAMWREQSRFPAQPCSETMAYPG